MNMYKFYHSFTTKSKTVIGLSGLKRASSEYNIQVCKYIQVYKYQILVGG